MDSYAVVISTVCGQLMVQYMAVCVWTLFNDTKTDQVANQQCDAQLSLNVKTGGSHTEFEMRAIKVPLTF